MNKPSKFAAVLADARRGPEPSVDAREPRHAIETHSPEPATVNPPALPSRGPGRPKGKRSDPAFEQVTAYLPTALYDRVRIALIQDGRRQDFSGLVAELLTAWADHR